MSRSGLLSPGSRSSCWRFLLILQTDESERLLQVHAPVHCGQPQGCSASVQVLADLALPLLSYRFGEIAMDSAIHRARIQVRRIAGRVLGIGFGFFLSWLIARTAEWKTIVTATSVITAFGVSVFVGVVFGIYPAFEASRINPIDALRYE